MEDHLVSAVAIAPSHLAPIDAASAGLEAARALLQERRAFAQHRHAVISANAQLQEREPIERASLSAAVAETLHGRGVGDTAASLTAEVAIAVFKIACERWIIETRQRDLPQLIRESLDELRTVAAGE